MADVGPVEEGVEGASGREPVTHSLKGSIEIDLSKIADEEDEDDG